MSKLIPRNALFLILYLTFSSKAWADGTTATAPDCSGLLTAVQGTSFASLPAATQAQYQSNLTICLTAGQTAFANQQASLKQQPLTDALSALAQNKSTNTGALTGATGLGHIADWQTQSWLNDVGTKIGTEVQPALKAGTPLILVLGNASALSSLGTARQHDRALAAAFERLHNQAEEVEQQADQEHTALITPKKPASEQKGQRKPLLDLLAPELGASLSLGNDVIGAVEGVAGLFKSSATVGKIDTLSSSDAALITGISSAGLTFRLANYYVPDQLPPIFALGTRADADLTALTNRSTMLQADADSAAKAKKKPTTNFVTAQTNVKTVMDALSGMTKLLYTTDANGVMPLETLGNTESLFNDHPQILLVTVPQIGGSVTSATHTFESDTVSFQTTGTITYLLLDAAGGIVKGNFKQPHLYTNEGTVKELDTIASGGIASTTPPAKPQQ